MVSPKKRQQPTLQLADPPSEEWLRAFVDHCPIHGGAYDMLDVAGKPCSKCRRELTVHHMYWLHQHPLRNGDNKAKWLRELEAVKVRTT